MGWGQTSESSDGWGQKGEGSSGWGQKADSDDAWGQKSETNDDWGNSTSDNKESDTGGNQGWGGDNRSTASSGRGGNAQPRSGSSWGGGDRQRSGGKWGGNGQSRTGGGWGGSNQPRSSGGRGVSNKPSSGGGWGSDDKSSSGGGWGSDNKSSSGGGWGNDDKSSTGGGWGNDDKSSSGGGWGNDEKSTSGGGWGSDEKSTSGGGWGSDEKSASGGGWGNGSRSQVRGERSGYGNAKESNRTSSESNTDQDDTKRKRFKGENGLEEDLPPFRPQEVDLVAEAKLQADGAGENFQKYKEQLVTCFPPDMIKPIEKFDDVLESQLLLQNIKTQKYDEMTPIQKWAMPAILDGKDLIGCAQTGSGKTAAFLLPVLQTLLKMDLESNDPNSDCQNPYCLIVSPTRELARQTYINASILSKDSIIKCHVIYGQISTAHLKANLSTGCHILVATPGRLKDFVERGWIGFKNLKYIILDEGDRLIDDGFKEVMKEFFNHPTMPSKEERQTLFFSATFKNETQMVAKEFLKDNFIFLTVGRVGAANEDIKQEFLRVSRQEKKRELKQILGQIPEEDKTIVFTQTKAIADILAGFFTALNLSATSIHGDRHQSQREQAIQAFRRGEKRFLISSPVGNRGLDLPKVAVVINYDLPNNIDEYVHRIGRTGRAGHTGRAISFYDEERDYEILPGLLEILKEAKQEIPDWMESNGSVVAENKEQPADGSNEDWGDAPAEALKSTEEQVGKTDNATPVTIDSLEDDWN